MSDQSTSKTAATSPTDPAAVVSEHDQGRNRRPSRAPAPTPLVKPRALRKGDTIGIIAPSSPMFEEGEIEFAFQWLAKIGLKYKIGKHVFKTYSDYAGQDEARAEDFHTIWSDPDVDAVVPLRGGNGAARILPLLDFELIKSKPKLFVGYSDITALHVPIHQRTRLVTFYGPMAASFFKSSYSYHYFTKAVMSTRAIGLIADPVPNEVWSPVYPPPRLIIAEGKARGRLTGGCLTLVRQLEGTPYALDTKDKLLFLEDLEEEPHAIDRILSQLLLAGKLQQAAGILIAECVSCKPGDSHRNVLHLNHSVERVLHERLGNLGIPVVYGLRFGHGKDQFTVPYGVSAMLEASRGKVRFRIEESACH
ncbi:MAG: LD-carboxypeptidase [Candidatus Obscuribacterales bacterium]